MNPVSIPTDWLGWLAASLTRLSFVPQAVLTLRKREVLGISAIVYGVFTVGAALWLAYGCLMAGAWANGRSSWPMR